MLMTQVSWAVGDNFDRPDGGLAIGCGGGIWGWVSLGHGWVGVHHPHHRTQLLPELVRQGQRLVWGSALLFICITLNHMWGFSAKPRLLMCHKLLGHTFCTRQNSYNLQDGSESTLKALKHTSCLNSLEISDLLCSSLSEVETVWQEAWLCCWQQEPILEGLM